MSHLEDIKKKFLDPAMTTSDPAELEKASALWRSAAEAEKLEQETAKVRLETASISRVARYESQRFWVSVLVPIISAAAVVGALWVQVYQVNLNSRLQRESNEAQNFRESLKMISSREPDTRTAGGMLISAVLQSRTYGATARQITIGLLSQLVDVSTFTVLFQNVMATTDWYNVKDVAHLSRTVTERYKSEQERVQTSEKAAARVRKTAETDPAVLIPALDEEMIIVGKGLAQFLRAHPKRASDVELDLSGTNLSWQDLSNINFKDAILNQTWILNSDVRGSDFTDVEAFEGSVWTGTAWWLAKKISGKLLAYVSEQYGFNWNDKYFRDNVNTEVYCKELARLGSKDKECLQRLMQTKPQDETPSR